jgi:hypothetical protein
MKTFRITYLSGQSLLAKGSSLAAVAASAEAGIAQFKIGRPHVGILAVEEVKK